MYGKDYEYAKSRIERTILCLVSGEAVMIEGVSSINGQCVVRSLRDNDEAEPKLVPLSAINCKPPRLGYCNSNGVASYVSRMPLRRDYKQGLRRENMTSSPVNIARIQYKDLSRCISKDYPTLDNAYKAVCKVGVQSIAFNQHWAIDRHLNIMYKHNVVVGRYNPKSNEIELSESHHHLFETLKDIL